MLFISLSFLIEIFCNIKINKYNNEKMCLLSIENSQRLQVYH